MQDTAADPDHALQDNQKVNEEAPVEDFPEEEPRCLHVTFNWFEKARPWCLTPSTKRQWLFFCCFWLCLVGGLGYLLVWGLPKLVDNVVDPATQKVQVTAPPPPISHAVSLCMLSTSISTRCLHMR